MPGPETMEPLSTCWCSVLSLNGKNSGEPACLNMPTSYVNHCATLHRKEVLNQASSTLMSKNEFSSASTAAAMFSALHSDLTGLCKCLYGNSGGKVFNFSKHP